MRLIDADALLESAGLFEAKACARGCGKSTLSLAKAWIWNEVDKSPTIDAVPVVRCCDCKRSAWRKSPFGVQTFTCELLCADIKQDDFCSYGERKDGDGK